MQRSPEHDAFNIMHSHVTHQRKSPAVNASGFKEVHEYIAKGLLVASLILVSFLTYENQLP